MKLLDTHIQTFGKLKDQTITFTDGIHLIYGENESGKSTFHTFLQSMLLGMERGRGRASRSDTFSRFLPWESGGIYGGDLRYEYQGKVHTLKRNFLSDPVGEKLPDSLGLTPARCKNTVSIGQMACQTDSSLSEELENHLVNLSLSGSQSIDIPAALAELKQTRKSFEKQLFPDTPASALLLEEQLKDTEQLLQQQATASSSPKLQQRLSTLDTQIKAQSQAVTRLRALISKGKEALSLHGFDSQDALEKRRCQAENAWATLQACRRTPFASTAIDWDLPSYFISICFLLGACYMILLRPSLIRILICYLGYVIFGLISRQFQRRGETQYWKEQSSSWLQKEFQEILYRDEVTKENFEEYMQELSDYENLFNKTAASAAHLEEQLTGLVSRQEEAARLRGLKENSREEEQKQEALLQHYEKLQSELQTVREHLAHNRKLQEEIHSLTLAYNTLEELSLSFHEQLTPELNQTASQILRELTDGRYSSMTIQRDLTITLTSGRQTVTPAQVSRGTLEQVYLAFRLALIPLFFKEEPMPLFLDDTFVAYDDKRLTRALTFLSEHYPGQIFLFTCQKREEQILQEAGIKYHKISLFK